jgi:hypothetical protein
MRLEQNPPYGGIGGGRQRYALKFDRPGGASSYLFLNNAGESGVVFVDANGVRRLNVLVGTDSDAKIEHFGSDGKPIPQLTA